MMTVVSNVLPIATLPMKQASETVGPKPKAEPVTKPALTLPFPSVFAQDEAEAYRVYLQPKSAKTPGIHPVADRSNLKRKPRN